MSGLGVILSHVRFCPDHFALHLSLAVLVTASSEIFTAYPSVTGTIDSKLIDWTSISVTRYGLVKRYGHTDTHCVFQSDSVPSEWWLLRERTENGCMGSVLAGWKKYCYLQDRHLDPKLQQRIPFPSLISVGMDLVVGCSYCCSLDPIVLGNLHVCCTI